MSQKAKTYTLEIAEIPKDIQFPILLEFKNSIGETKTEKNFWNIIIFCVLIGAIDIYYYRKVSYEILLAFGFLWFMFSVESSKRKKANNCNLNIKIDQNGVYLHPSLVDQVNGRRYLKNENLIFVPYVEIFDWYFYDSSTELKYRDKELKIDQNWPDRYIIELRNNKIITVRRDFLLPVENQLLSFMRYFLIKHSPYSLVAQLPVV